MLDRNWDWHVYQDGPLWVAHFTGGGYDVKARGDNVPSAMNAVLDKLDVYNLAGDPRYPGPLDDGWRMYRRRRGR